MSTERETCRYCGRGMEQTGLHGSVDSMECYDPKDCRAHLAERVASLQAKAELVTLKNREIKALEDEVASLTRERDQLTNDMQAVITLATDRLNVEVERLTSERDAARELLQGLIYDSTLPEHLRCNAHKVLAAVVKVAKERDEAKAKVYQCLTDLSNCQCLQFQAERDAALRQLDKTGITLDAAERRATEAETQVAFWQEKFDTAVRCMDKEEAIAERRGKLLERLLACFQETNGFHDLAAVVRETEEEIR